VNTETLLRHLKALDACADAREWVATQPDAATAWATCPRAGWLVWVLGELHVRGALSRQTLVLAACACAETALRHAHARDDCPRLAIEAARRWARGEATVAEVRAASDDVGVGVVACAAFEAAATCAAFAAADADAAGAAADAADAAADFAGYPDSADAVRNAVPWETVVAALLGIPT
jgi:hypothetical protein